MLKACLHHVMQANIVSPLLLSLHRRLSLLESAATAKYVELSADLGNVRIDGEVYTMLSDESDDGYVVKVNKPDEEAPYVIKVYKTYCRDCGSIPEKYEAITKDLATRELKALTLLKGHPNFPKIYSTELDTCALNHSSSETPSSWAIRYEYLPGLQNLLRSPFDLLGFVVDDQGKISIDYEMVHTVALYIFGQVASIVNELRERKIMHRDIDNGNFMVQIPTARLYLFDFARSDVPHVDGMEDTESPDSILQKCEQRLTKRRRSQDEDEEKWETFEEIRRIEEEDFLSEYKAMKYRNVTNQILPQDLKKRKTKLDDICMFYWVAYPLVRCVKFKSDDEVELIVFIRLINKMRVEFDADPTTLLRYQEPPVAELEQYKRATQKMKRKVYTEQIRHSEAYKAQFEEIKEKDVQSEEIVWDPTPT